MPHQCDCEPACLSQPRCVAAHVAGTAAGSEAYTEAGIVAYTGVEVEPEDGIVAAAWPPHGTGWRRPRTRWRSPGQSGWSKSPGSADWDWPQAGERPLMTACAQTSHLQNLMRSLSNGEKGMNLRLKVQLSVQLSWWDMRTVLLTIVPGGVRVSIGDCT